MSRTRRAAINVVFGYAGFVMSLLTGIALVPFTLARVGTETYGVWLGFGELLGYSAMLDIGILGILPWLVAEADGASDRGEIRRVFVGGLTLSVITGVVVCAVALGLLLAAPYVARVSDAQRAAVFGPLVMAVACTFVAYPLRACHAVLVGLQDVVFVGWAALAQQALAIAVLVTLLLRGQGIWAVAASTSVPALVVAAVSAARLRRRAPDLFRGWARPAKATLVRITGQGFGGWTAGLGWRMVSATDNLVILSVAGPAMAVVYAMTVKLAEALTQMSWHLVDSGMVGLAQLRGEGRVQRVREIVVAMLRLTLLGAGAVACVVVALNPSFVSLWVGTAKFGGVAMNAWVAAEVVALSLTHGLFAPAATLGQRVQTGWAVVAQGVFHVGAAVLLGHWFGATGVVAAGFVSSMLVAYPAGVRLVSRASGLAHGDLLRGAVLPWAARIAPLLVLAAAVALLRERVSPWAPLALAPFLGLTYLWTMRPLYRGIPLPGRIQGALARLRLVPAVEPGG
ncbi:MAG: Na+-driven multidrug efflux pump [Gemmatimonadetes bacterium]|nr:Na+-driven multidrug efflux pump [Gemmatimonadota bacterium]